MTPESHYQVSVCVRLKTAGLHERCFISSLPHSVSEREIRSKIRLSFQLVPGNCKLTVGRCREIQSYGTCKRITGWNKRGCYIALWSRLCTSPHLILCQSNVHAHRHMLSFNDSTTPSIKEMRLRLQWEEKNTVRRRERKRCTRKTTSNTSSPPGKQLILHRKKDQFRLTVQTASQL